MVSTVTTTINSATTTSAAAGSEIAVFGLMSALTLAVYLGFQEITTSGNNLLLHRLSRTANTAVVPLLFALVVTMVIRIATAP